VSQHTEAVGVSLAAPEAEILLAAQDNAFWFPAAIKVAIPSLAAAAKRLGAGGRLVLSVMMACAVFGDVHQVLASIVTTTITGTVAQGKDQTGVFGFAPGSSLQGQDFKLVFSFDDTKGKQNVGKAGGVPCTSSITNTGTSNPGTAVLQIGTGSWTFGALPNDLQNVLASRVVGNCGASFDYQIIEQLTNGGPGYEDNDSIYIQAYYANGSIPSTDYSWEDSLPTLQITGIALASFEINVTSGVNGQLVNGAGANLNPTSITVSGLQSGPPSTAGLQFIPVTPCRVADTRNAAGPFGGPELAAGASREFDIPQSACSIPSSAVAYSLNLTAVPNAALGYLTMWPSGQTQPTVSTLNSDGRVKANAAITPAGTNGGVSVFVTNPSHVILDINGYFVPAGTASALAFYPVTPCRIVDTRNATGPFGGPSLAAASSRDFSPQSSNCALPSDAKAYSLNVTAVPKGGLGYLTMWPSGQTQPLTSTLNSPTGAVTANAAIVPAGSNGDVSVYVSNASDVIVDVNGYFAAPSANGLSLYTTTPCRVIDTRNGSGAFNGTFAEDVESSTCAPSSTAQAYVLNATVVPTGSLGYLTLWPAGQTQPVVSTLNASDGVVTSNMAVVPTMNGSIDAFSSSSTQLILDLSSYFAP
jgi:hypothetical protein